MMTPEALSALRERLIAATGPDARLNAEIACAFVFPDLRPAEADHYTNSIDAALGLVARLLPGWACGFDRGPKTCIAFVDPHDHEDRFTGARHTATAPTAPLALLIALVSALSQPGVQS